MTDTFRERRRSGVRARANGRSEMTARSVSSLDEEMRTLVDLGLSLADNLAPKRAHRRRRHSRLMKGANAWICGYCEAVNPLALSRCQRCWRDR